MGRGTGSGNTRTTTTSLQLVVVLLLKLFWRVVTVDTRVPGYPGTTDVFNRAYGQSRGGRISSVAGKGET
eukprot:2414685-Rhodomonas_salina.1